MKTQATTAIRILDEFKNHTFEGRTIPVPPFITGHEAHLLCVGYGVASKRGWEGNYGSLVVNRAQVAVWIAGKGVRI